ncbi:MAG TPA: Lrp/AsnC family transcriptional regulator [Ktedonobacterales bacterium]|nr:Lrp/AsnC family transcriptional regulator [Ktedonobacterales bacterium]
MIDEIDGKILSILQNDARTSNAEIARRLVMAPSAILERIRKLETRGLIDGYEARLNPEALDLGLLAFIYVRADERIGSRVIGDELAAFPEVQEVHHIAGEDCYLLKVRVADTNALSDLLRQRLGPIDAIRSTRTTIVLSTIKETAQIPLPSTVKEDLSDAG